MARFQRPVNISGKRNKEDATGRVAITVQLYDPDNLRSHTKKGNMSKRISVADAKVSDVVKALEVALFSDSAED